MWLTVRTCLALLGFLGLSISATGQCQRQQVNTQLVKGDQAGALKYSDACVAFGKAHAPKEVNTLEDALSVFLEFYDLCVRAQVQAIMGKEKDAAKSIKEAEQVLTDLGGWVTSPLLEWQPVIEITKGFALEEAGKTTGAKKWYVDHPSDYTRERLAVLALSSNRDEATQYAAYVLAHNPKDATAHAVLAAILEKNGKRDEALAEYRTALKYMAKEELGNQFLPVVVAESATANSGITRLLVAKP